MAVLFDLTNSGSASVGAETWRDLGLLPTGARYWIGKAVYTAIGKLMTFELRTNTVGKSAGTTAATTLLDTAAVKAGTTISRDLYQNGRLHVATVIGAGVEHWWLRIYSKTTTASTSNYSLNYTRE
jgi:hypothetical protein